MMRLDNGGLAKTGLDNVRVNGSLHQEVHGSDFLRFFLKDADEFLTDNLSLCFRLCYALQLVVVALLRVDADKVQFKGSIGPEDCLHLVALVFAEQAVIYEHAGQLLSDCFGKQNGRHGRIHAA